MMKRFLLASVFVCGIAAPAYADGALAVGIPDGGLRAGFAYGWYVRGATAAEAEREALAGCRRQANKQSFPESKCQVVESFRNRCVSVAFDTTEYWAGWGVGDNEEAARDVALKKCSEGARGCRVADVNCDR